jgi:MoxR-like ATPase
MTSIAETKPDLAHTAELLCAVTAELADAYWERSAAVRALVTAVLAGQHRLLLGPPGTGKSALERDLAGRIDGARYWRSS